MIVRFLVFRVYLVKLLGVNKGYNYSASVLFVFAKIDQTLFYSFKNLTKQYFLIKNIKNKNRQDFFFFRYLE